MGRSVWCSFSWGEPMFAQDRAPKVGLHIGTTSSECAVSIRLHLGVNFGQDGPNCSPISTHLAPTSANIPQLGPRLDHLGAIRPKLGSTWLQNGAHGQPNTKSLRLRWANLREAVAKAFQACWAWLGLSYASHGFNLGTIWIALELQPNMTNWRLGLQLGPKQHSPGPTVFGFDGVRRQIPVGGKLGPSWSQQARVRCKFCPSWAQVGSCSAQVKAKDGQVWPSRLWLGQVALVGPNSLGAGGSRHEATQIKFLYN